MPEILDQEALDFLLRFVGGSASALTENAFVYAAQQNPALFGTFPYNKPDAKLPYYYQILVGGISIAEALAGLGIEEDPAKVLDGMDYKTKQTLQEFGKGLRKFGEGGVLYSAPMLTARTIAANVPAPVVGGNPATLNSLKPPAQQPGRVIKL